MNLKFVAQKMSALFLMLCFSCAAAAQQLPTGWASVRALGMGNAYTAAVDNSDAMFYNPAALMRVNGVNWTIMDPRVGIDNPSNAQLISSLSNTQNLASTINSLYGNQIWAGGGGMSAITVPNFGIAAYANSEAGALVGNPPDPQANLNYYFDYGAALSTSLELIPGIFSIGATARWVDRTGYVGNVGASVLSQSSTAALQNLLKSRGSAIGVDFGSLIVLPGPVSPALSFVYRDIGNTTFSHAEGAGAPPPVASEMIVGASVAIKVPLIKITPAIDYRYIGQSGVQLGENINLGVELSLPLIDLRGGLSQGYYTAGVGINLLGLLRADVATWAVEMGAYPGQQVDRRYMAQVTFELSFDPGKFLGGSFRGGSDGSGSSGRSQLFQRR